MDMGVDLCSCRGGALLPTSRSNQTSRLLRGRRRHFLQTAIRRRRVSRIVYKVRGLSPHCSTTDRGIRKLFPATVCSEGLCSNLSNSRGGVTCLFLCREFSVGDWY